MNPRRVALILSAACIAALPPVLAAQDAVDDEGPIIIDREIQREGLHLDPTELTLDLVGAYQQSRYSSGGEKTNSKQWIFTQVLNSRTHGYYLHPNFIDFNVAFGGGLEETYADFAGDSQENIGPVYNWDIDVTILRNGEWPLTLFSRRQQAWLFRDFGGAIDTDTTETGASVSHIHGNTSTMLTLSHIETNQNGLDDFDDLSYTQDRFSWYSFTDLGPGQTLEWSYNFNQLDQSGFTDYMYQTHDALLTHRLRFGDDMRDELTSTANYYAQTGSSDYQRFRWTERLDLHHSETFRTWYDYQYTWADLGPVQRDTHRAKTGFQHRLYRSLVTTGNIGVQRTTDSEDFASTTYFGDLGWDYRKSIPFGTLSAHLNLGFSRDENSASSAITIFDVPATFTDPVPIVLTGNGISGGSIVLTDPSGFLYLPGVDYNVTDLPGRVEIQRIVGGRIADGQTVLIDYTQQALPGSTIDTQNLSTGLRYDIQEGFLNGLSLYGRYATQTQSIETSDTSAFTPDSYDDYLYGSEYRIGPLTFGAEEQRHESDLYPYDASRLFARFSKANDETTWSISGAYTSLTYPLDDNKVDFYTVSARVDHRFSTRLTGAAVIMWRDETNRLFGDTTGFEEQLELNWKHRQLEAYVQFRASQLESESYDTAFEFIRIGIRRQF